MIKDSGLKINNMVSKKNFIIANTKYSTMKIVLWTLLFSLCHMRIVMKALI